MMNFNGKAAKIADVDLPRIGAEIGVGEDEIHAVIDVECRGSGFDSKGRPAMLFEPHIFYRQLSGSARDLAVRKGLAWPKWKRDYPKDSYPRLIAAMDIDPEAALRSASWGMGQIMGFNAGLAGYASAFEMVNAFLESEAVHLAAMVRFIASAGLDDELRRHDWAGFARGYNGSGYAANAYDKRLAAAFEKWSRIPDTEWKRAEAVKTAHTAPAEGFVRPDAPVAPPAREVPPAPSAREVPDGQNAAAGMGVAIGAVATALIAAVATWWCSIPGISWFCGG